MRPGLLAHLPLYRKFLVATFLIMLGAITFSMVASLLVEAIWGLNAMQLNPSLGPNHVAAMKLLVFVGTGLGSFLIPALLGSFLLFESPKAALGLHMPLGGSASILLAVTALVFSLPVINFMVMLNEYLVLPSFLSDVELWMRETEKQLEVLTEAMMVMQQPSDLLLNLAVIALVPAVAEELLFRGLIQNLFSKLTTNIHVAIWITAALFSAIHMQFYGFIPRMVLGAAFGYMLFWSGSIWLPIAAHFANNGFAVLITYLNQQAASPLFDEHEIGKGPNDILLLIISIGVVGFCMWRIRKKGLREAQLDSNSGH